MINRVRRALAAWNRAVIRVDALDIPIASPCCPDRAAALKAAGVPGVGSYR